MGIGAVERGDSDYDELEEALNEYEAGHEAEREAARGAARKQQNATTEFEDAVKAALVAGVSQADIARAIHELTKEKNSKKYGGR